LSELKPVEGFMPGFGPRQRQLSAVYLSVVVPLYDEEDNIEPLHQAVTSHLSGMNCTYELLLVDDGSRDATFNRAVAIATCDSRVRVIKLRRNYGQTAAFAAGIAHARGTIIVTMDGDLQNDPADIPRLLAEMNKGYDLVVGWRVFRRDKLLRRVASSLANRLIARIMGIPIHDTGCSLKAFRAELAASLPLYGEMHRFIPILSRIAGARIVEVEVAHHMRTHGVSKYGFGRVPRVVLDMISVRLLLGYMARPRLWTGALAGAALTITLVLTLSSLIVGMPLIVGAICALCASLAVFLGAWSIVAYHVVALDPRGGRFPVLAARRAE
jgi:glycosyltransferase involved in cell wall biosynthesis